MLNEFGKIAVAEIVTYAPILGIALFLTIRHGIVRTQGWFFLSTYATVRIIGAITTIVSQSESQPSSGLLIAVGILQALGLSPLLLSTLSFLANIQKHALPNATLLTHLLHIWIMIGVIMGVVGGIKSSPGHTESETDSGHTFSRVGSIFFLGAYGALILINLALWKARNDVPSHLLKLLKGLSFALPFLAVRVLYSILGAFVTPTPSRWSPTTGNWGIYLVMGLITEYAVVSIYIFTGITTPLHYTYERPRYATGSDDGTLEMGMNKYKSGPGTSSVDLID